MGISQLPLNSVLGFKGSIAEFIQLTTDEAGHVTKVVANPTAEVQKDILDSGNARRYLGVMMDIPLRYRVLRVKQHLYIDVAANIGFTDRVGVVWAAGTYTGAYAMDQQVRSNGIALTDNERFGQASLAKALALDTILQSKVVIDVKAIDEAAERPWQKIGGLADYLLALMEAPDLPAAMAIRAKAINDKQEARLEWNSARDEAQGDNWVRPESLVVVINGGQRDLIQVPTRKYRLTAVKDREVFAKKSFNWNGGDTELEYAERLTAQGYEFQMKERSG